MKDIKNQLHTRNKGSISAEFVLVLPSAFIIILSFIVVSIMCVRGELLDISSFIVARGAKVYTGGTVASKLRNAMPKAISDGLSFGLLSLPDSWHESIMAKHECVNCPSLGNFAHKIGVMRSSPVARALPSGLNNAILKNGDAVSPYCNYDGGYFVCGYSK